jgi:hypothetical protein
MNFGSGVSGVASSSVTSAIGTEVVGPIDVDVVVEESVVVDDAFGSKTVEVLTSLPGLLPPVPTMVVVVDWAASGICTSGTVIGGGAVVPAITGGGAGEVIGASGGTNVGIGAMVVGASVDGIGKGEVAAGVGPGVGGGSGMVVAATAGTTSTGGGGATGLLGVTTALVVVTERPDSEITARKAANRMVRARGEGVMFADLPETSSRCPNGVPGRTELRIDLSKQSRFFVTGAGGNLVPNSPIRIFSQFLEQIPGVARNRVRAWCVGDR